MAAKSKKSSTLPEPQNPLILRCHRLMEAFAKSDDERDFYLDRVEGFILFADLDKTEEELDTLQQEIRANAERYCQIPKLSFYESKKLMEGFVQEKVYDIDTREKLMDIIQSKEARENFLEFIYDHHSELEKWQQFYQERSRIRIIEWLRNHHFLFVFEEDLDLARSLVEKLKETLFEKDVSKELSAARKVLVTKSKTYYSNEALNPRPKRGRPPKQVQKLEVEPQVSGDIYTQVPKVVRPFLFTPDITSALDVTFSSKFESGEELLAHRRAGSESEYEESIKDLNLKLATLRSLSNGWKEEEEKPSFDNMDEEEDDEVKLPKAAPKKPKAAAKKTVAKPKKSEPAATKKPASSGKEKPQKLRRTAKSAESEKSSVKKPKKSPAKKETKASAKSDAKPKRKLLRRTRKKS